MCVVLRVVFLRLVLLRVALRCSLLLLLRFVPRVVWRCVVVLRVALLCARSSSEALRLLSDETLGISRWLRPGYGCIGLWLPQRLAYLGM